MLLGRRRHTARRPRIAELRDRMTLAPPSPRSIDPAIPEAVDAIVTRCLAPDPAARFQTTDDLLAALDRLDGDGRPLPSDQRLIHFVVAGPSWS